MLNCTQYANRRAFLASLGAGCLMTTPGLFASVLEDLTKTPHQTEGPFYPNKLPLDTDNDLLKINDALTSAVGQITHLTGRVLDATGSPVKNALVEIWQVDSHGAYLHEGSANREKWDTNFQGFGRFMTGRDGRYYFRTIKPVAYPGRTPHIHVKVKKSDKELLTTQCYIKGDKQNERDGILRRLNARDRAALEIDFAPIKESKIDELAANFDMVLGVTPAD